METCRSSGKENHDLDIQVKDNKLMMINKLFIVELCHIYMYLLSRKTGWIFFYFLYVANVFSL